MRDIFCLPCQSKYLVYAPRHGFAALMNRAAADEIRRGIENGTGSSGKLGEIISEFCLPGEEAPLPRKGPVSEPLFLGLIPTRACNMDCGYCDFDSHRPGSAVMSIDLARDAIDAYIDLLQKVKKDQLEIHFFGGEPFYAWEVVFFAVQYARLRAAELGLTVRFEAITNGLYAAERARWIADRFDTVVLSLDGPEEIQDRQRHGIKGANPAPTILKNAKIFADGTNELALRACITSDNVGRMAEIADWMTNEFHPSCVCLETMTPSPRSQNHGLYPPDPFDFVHGFLAAEQIFAKSGIDTILSTVNSAVRQTSFCPVGQDALIVTPDGMVNACYWLEDEWIGRGLDLNLGEFRDSRLLLDPASVQRVRDLTIENKQACDNCLSKFQCAGGCHVRRADSPTTRRNAEVCIQTRLITTAHLLMQLGHDALLAAILADQSALERIAFQLDDRLLSQEFTI